MPSCPHIRILMCTWNGARYLQDQLDSFLRQDHADWSLWVSDDGSADATRAILAEFQAENPGHDIRIFEGPRQGGVANYMSLIQRCVPDPDVLVALSDQDDVWLPDKLGRAAAAIAAASGSGPVAYGAAQIISDAGLGRQRPSRPVRAGPSFRNALVQNILSGNSLVINAATLDLIQRNLPTSGIQGHDWWIYLLTTGAGGRAIHDPRPALIYRQHDGNTLGSNLGFAAMKQRIAMVYQREYLGWLRANIAALQPAHPDLTPENRVLLQRFAETIGQGGLRRARLLGQLGIGRQGRLGTLVLRLLAVIGRV